VSWFLGDALVGLLLVAVVAGAKLKYRAVWRELFRLRRELDLLMGQVVASRKDATLALIGEAAALPLALPSQNGEDVILWNFFGRKRKGFYVEVGAYDGFALSNTYFFEAIGWGGVLIEAAPDLHRACVIARPGSVVVHAAVGKRAGSTTFTVVSGERGVAALSSLAPDHARIAREGGNAIQVEVPMRTLDDILGDFPGAVDFVSIDVEGGELDVLGGFDIDRFRPRVLVIEENRPDDRAVAGWLANHGYVVRFRVEQNVFYVRENDPGTFA
jgi:FkbM family methyltransferase